jgi:pimeloyl-ACP methyl ester carboxylesterase
VLALRMVGARPETGDVIPMDLPAKTYDAEVTGGTLRVLSWGDGPRPVLAVHGITANATCWLAVARALPDDCQLFAVDLRGRGHSAALPGPYGFDQHVADLRDAVRALGLDRPVLVGHSLGAYLALLAADADPAAFSRLVLVDGGLPVPVPADADLDAVLAASLGPAVARLTETYPTPEAYVEFWRGHPALARDWSSDVEQYARYDLTGEPGQLRSRVAAEAVRTDSRDLLTSGERLAAALGRLTGRTPLLRAPAGMFGQPPGLITEELAAYWQARTPALQVQTIPATNHYTILFSPAAVAAVATELTRD